MNGSATIAATPTQTYTYEPVPKEGLHTHILMLYPGQFDDEIRLHLVQTDLSLPEVFEYEALSYAWGCDDLSQVANVVGRHDNPGGTLPITDSLDTALRYLRHERRRRSLWIDAISIDQGNKQEKSHQVQWMHEVYKRARRVIIFLGPAFRDADLAMEKLSLIGRSVSINTNPGGDITSVDVSARPPPSLFSDIHARFPIISMSDLLMHAVATLLERPWFSRLWVVQEVRSMRDTTQGLVQCGSRTISWDDFRKSCLCIWNTSWGLLASSTAFRSTWQRLVKSKRILCNTARKVSLYNYASLADFDCSDPRDRLYAILNLVRDELEYDVTVDYTRTVEDVFEDLQRQELRTKGVWLLENCHLDLRRDWRAPSWVPNPQSIPVYIGGTLFSTLACFSPHHEFVGNRGLRVNGCHVAVVQTVATWPPLMSEWPLVDGPALMWTWLEDLVRSLYERKGLHAHGICGNQVAETVLRLCDIILYDTYSEGQCNGPPGGLTRSRVKSIFRTKLSQHSPSGENTISAPSEKYTYPLFYFIYGNLRKILSYSSQPAIFMTESHDVGYGPQSTLPGDQVCAILGCRKHMILRPTNFGKHVVVGPATISCDLRNEALLGPLPGHIWFALDGEKVLHTFRDTRTGKPVHDPRLEQFGLLKGLSDTYIQGGAFDVSPEDMIQRGSPVEPFLLV